MGGCYTVPDKKRVKGNAGTEVSHLIKNTQGLVVLYKGRLWVYTTYLCNHAHVRSSTSSTSTHHAEVVECPISMHTFHLIKLNDSYFR